MLHALSAMSFIHEAAMAPFRPGFGQLERSLKTDGALQAKLLLNQQESSARLTNQRVSYAFISSTLSFHACHILPTSKFQHSYSCILLIFYRHQ